MGRKFSKILPSYKHNSCSNNFYLQITCPTKLVQNNPSHFIYAGNTKVINRQKKQQRRNTPKYLRREGCKLKPPQRRRGDLNLRCRVLAVDTATNPSCQFLTISVIK